jgi:SHS2 domain-containing protein
MPYRILNHTADVAVLLRGADAAGLCRALVDCLRRLYAGPVRLRPHGRKPLAARADSVEGLLVALANEIIFRFDARGELTWNALSLTVEGDEEEGYRLTADVEWVDARDGLEQENDLKAATWHGLAVRRTARGDLEATLVIDT